MAPAPALLTKDLQKHAWKANGWIAHSAENSLDQAIKKGNNGWKMLAKIKSENDLPPCLYTHLTGVIVTIGGMPVDLGLPGDIDLGTLEKIGMI